MGRTALKDRLVSAYSPGNAIVGCRLERSKERRCPRQVALALGDARFVNNSSDIVRHNIENLIKLPSRFGEASKRDIACGALDKQVDVAWVQALGLAKVGLA